MKDASSFVSTVVVVILFAVLILRTIGGVAWQSAGVHALVDTTPRRRSPLSLHHPPQRQRRLVVMRCGAVAPPQPPPREHSRRKRDWFRRPWQSRMGQHRPSDITTTTTTTTTTQTDAPPSSRKVHHSTTLDDFESYWNRSSSNSSSSSSKTTTTNYTERQQPDDYDRYDALLRGVHVTGDTQIIGSTEWSNYTHPVVQILHERRRRRRSSSSSQQGSQPLSRDNDDGAKVALAIEGGGMRGCVSAGMVCAIHHLNLTDSLDVVYGSSAGTIVGAYLITGQLPWFGPELYYDRLTTAGRKFIDTRRLVRALGLGLLDPRLWRDVLTRRDAGKPVLNLKFLLKTTVQETKPLDWETFVQRQATLPLNVVTSGLARGSAVVLNMANGGFNSLDELTDCMHASCLLPGIAGPIMNIDQRVLVPAGGETSVLPPTKGQQQPKMVVRNNMDTTLYEPLADALFYEPLPYRTAINQDNVTHCLVLRSRPDGVDVTGKGGFAERWIAQRFFQRKNPRLAHQYRRLIEHEHKYIYAQDVLRLNDQAYSRRDPYDNTHTTAKPTTTTTTTTTTTEPHLMAVAVPPNSPEVSRLEVGRSAIFQGLRRGFARAYDCLVEDPAERGRGWDVARLYFPDEILDYNPLEINVTNQSAFAAYLNQVGVVPKAWKDDMAMMSRYFRPNQ